MYGIWKETDCPGIGGGNDSYWTKNKSRSKEGKLVMVTTISAVLFIVFSVVLNLNLF